MHHFSGAARAYDDERKDDDDHDDDDDDTINAPLRGHRKKLDIVVTGPDGSESSRMEDEAVSPPPADSEAQGEGDDVAARASFEALLEKFALMHTESSSSGGLSEREQTEECPICAQKLRLGEFAGHVFSCLAVLDAVDMQKQIDDDDKLARRLAAENHHSYSPWRALAVKDKDKDSSDDAMEQEGATEVTAGKQIASVTSGLSSYREPGGERDGDDVPVCVLAIKCHRRDSYHFRAFVHPTR